MTIETPLLDEISLKKWFNAKYNEGQMVEIESLIEQHVWMTARRVKIPVREMDTNHIINCIKCWQGLSKTRIPVGYLGGKDKWLKIFYQELLNRQ